MNKWECPECGHKNHIETILCPCGFLDTPATSEKVPSNLPDALAWQPPENIPQKNAEDVRVAPRSNRMRLSIFEDLFDLASWRYSYSRWMLMLVMVIFIYRRTTDGLWFIAYVAIAIAGRFEARKRYGKPFIPGKQKHQSLREYGYCRAIVDALFPVFAETEDRYVELFHRLVRGALLITILLHIYVGFVIICNTVNADFMTRFFTVLHRPFADLLSHWPSFQATAERLISHGYGYRVPIVSHVYIVSVIGCIATTVYWITGFRCAEPLSYYYDERPKRYMEYNGLNIYKAFKNTVFQRFIALTLGGYPGKIVVIAALTAAVYFLNRLPILFPGEPAPRHGKYIWIASYVYKDDIGLFSPICYLVFFFYPFPIFVFHLFEPFYRVGFYCLRILKR